jgi:hypothetical protein
MSGLRYCTVIISRALDRDRRLHTICIAYATGGHTDVDLIAVKIPSCLGIDNAARVGTPEYCEIRYCFRVLDCVRNKLEDLLSVSLVYILRPKRGTLTLQFYV